MTEKEKRIADLRKQLLAPQPKRKAPVKAAVTTQNNDDDMQNKFRRVMDWGTPRIVVPKGTNHRVINMNNVSMASRSNLLQIANLRKGNLPSI